MHVEMIVMTTLKFVNKINLINISNDLDKPNNIKKHNVFYYNDVQI